MALQSPLQSPRKLPENGQKTHKNACFLPFFDFFSPITPQSFNLKKALIPLDCHGENSVAIIAKYQGIGNSDAPILLFTLSANFS